MGMLAWTVRQDIFKGSSSFPQSLRPALAASSDHVDRNDRPQTEDIMLKHLAICAVLFAFGTAAANAQQQEAVLQRISVPGAGFDILLATPKQPRNIINLDMSPDALVVRLIGGELALSFDAETKMLQALDSLRMPACAFHVKGSKSPKPVAVYVMPKD
jgi:hypothetical protein